MDIGQTTPLGSRPTTVGLNAHLVQRQKRSNGKLWKVGHAGLIPFNWPGGQAIRTQAFSPKGQDIRNPDFALPARFCGLFSVKRVLKLRAITRRAPLLQAFNIVSSNSLWW